MLHEGLCGRLDCNSHLSTWKLQIHVDDNRPFFNQTSTVPASLSCSPCTATSADRKKKEYCIVQAPSKAAVSS
jgi:hypothetical protein